ncbi:IclR family transcriptional regulator [Nocardia blacklockiae]|uniref:IclR family transcriptional regulator n=1 Tax=Nocardia blacklockiae TaxID=480036 RepID=UPI0018958AB3|nr:helix-turn-helix domain-containing protein [Nocardia blacklockiae]MBF6172399.1 helix-turn-helix domain-containing protein [Nocardia blacklockiae]
MNEATASGVPDAGGRGVLEGAFALLEALAHGGDLGLTQLSAATGLPKATAHRLLDQLVREGAVQRRAGRYQLGPRLFRLGQTWQPAHLLRAAVAQPVRQLAARSPRGGFSLSVADRGNHVLIGGVGREIDEVFPLRAGVLLPPSTAAGKVLSAATSEVAALRNSVPEGFSLREWQRATAAARDRGLAYDTDMHYYELACVAAPIRAPSGAIVAALAGVVLETRQLAEIAEPIRRAAERATVNLARLARFHRVPL